MAEYLRGHTFNPPSTSYCRMKGRITLSSHPPGTPPFYNDAPQCGERPPSYFVTNRPASPPGMLAVADI
jgi:hypothetical protein